jgi:hypothetical protein
MNIKHSLNLGNVCLKQGQLTKAYSHYNQAVSEAFHSRRVFKKWSTPPWPEMSYLVNQEYKFVYCPIPKVASTSLYCIMYLLSNPSERYKELTKFALSTQRGVAEGVNDYVHDLHRYVRHNLTLGNYSRKETRKIINSEQYFKFTVVRDPWKRLTSAYLNKLVDVDNPDELLPSARTVIEGFYAMKCLKPDYEKSITFRQFLDYIAATEERYLDVHWKTQNAFLENIKLDFVGKLETLSDDFEYIKRRINLKENLVLPKQNVTNYEKAVDSPYNYADLYPKELKQLERRPNYQSYYTSDLVDLVKQRYKCDFERFGYDDLTISSEG